MVSSIFVSHFSQLFLFSNISHKFDLTNSFCCPRRVETPLGEQTPEGIPPTFPNKSVETHGFIFILSAIVLMNVQCLHQLELALHYVWAPWSPWSGKTSPPPHLLGSKGWMGTDDQSPPSMFAASGGISPGIYCFFFFNLKILRQQTQAWRNCILQMRPLFHVRHTSNRSPQKTVWQSHHSHGSILFGDQSIEQQPNSMAVNRIVESTQNKQYF